MSLKLNEFLVVALGASVLLSGCGSSPAAESVKSMTPEYDANGRLSRLAYDRDQDGKVETWGYMAGTQVIRVEVDENADGKVDRWEFHNPAAADNAAADPGASPGAQTAPDKTIDRVERATRFDGKVTRREFFTDGALTRVEEDTDADGVLDKWETYSNGTLLTMALDTTNRGTPDRRLIYRADGTFDHLEVDETGSGQFVPMKP